MARKREPREGAPSMDMDYPSDPRLEASVLGACLSEGAHWWHAVETRTGSNVSTLFFDRQNVAVAEAIQQARREHNDISLAYVEMNLASSVGDDYFPNGIRPYLVSLQASTSISRLDNLNGVTTELLDLRSLRNILSNMESTSRDIFNGELNSYDASEKLRSIAAANATVKDVQTAGEILAALDEQGVAPWRVSTGFEEFDKLIKGGYEPGRIYVLGARPKVGKTTIAMNSALHVALVEDVNVLFVSLEMNRAEIMGKMIASLSGVEHSEVTRVINKEQDIDVLGAEAKAEYLEAREDLADSKLSLAFADNTRNGIQDIISMMLSMRARLGDGKPLVVYVDYAQLTVRDRFNMNNELDDIFRNLKLAAMELEAAIIAPSQVNREGGKEGGMPAPFHLAASGSLEQHGDMICMLHREAVDDEDAPKNVMDAHVALNRIGPSGYFKLNWVPEISYVEDLKDHVQEGRSSGGREPRRATWDEDDEDDDY